MIVTKKILAEMLMQYINREMALSGLVDWAENMLMEADFDEKSFELVRDIVARLGLADVREFGLSWDDCYDYLHKLGYGIRMELMETA